MLGYKSSTMPTQIKQDSKYTIGHSCVYQTFAWRAKRELRVDAHSAAQYCAIVRRIGITLNVVTQHNADFYTVYKNLCVRFCLMLCVMRRALRQYTVTVVSL